MKQSTERRLSFILSALVVMVVLAVAAQKCNGAECHGTLAASGSSAACPISPNAQTVRVKVWCASACVLTADPEASENSTDGWISLTNGTKIANPGSAGTVYAGPNPGFVRITVSGYTSGTVNYKIVEIKQ